MNRFADWVVEPTLWCVADWSIRWAVLIGVLAVWLLLVRPRRTATRYLVCWVVLLAGLSIPLLPRWGSGFARMPVREPVVNVIVDPVPIIDTAAPYSSPVLLDDAFKMPQAAEPAQVASVEPGPPAPDPITTRQVICLGVASLWVGGLLLSAIRWLVGWLVLHRLRRTALPLTGASVEPLAQSIAELGLRRRVTLVTHPRVSSPLTLGLRRPMILVPIDWPQRSPTVQRSSLLHELAHLARYDDWLALPLELVRAAFWFHPLVRWLLARIERERELRCDETAVGHGIDSRSYAEVLLEFARQPGRLLPAPLAIPAYTLRFGRRRTVKARIEHLLEDNMQRWITPLSPSRAIALAMTTLTFAAVLGCVRVQPEEQAAEIARLAANQPSPAAELKSSEFVPYRIQPFDVLKIRSQGDEILVALDPSGTCLVEPDGQVYLGPFYGRVRIGGLSIDEATKTVKNVVAKLVEGASTSVSVVGRVKKWQDDPSRKHPYFIRPRHVLEIRGMAVDTLERLQLNGRYVVDLDGHIEIGEFYATGGRLKLDGLTLQEASETLQRRVDPIVDNQKVAVIMGGWEELWQKIEDEEEKSPPAAQNLPKIPKEDLRYDNKSFEQWHRDLLTELKPEVRIDGIKAMAEFGANGYGEEATVVIGEIVRTLDDSQVARFQLQNTVRTAVRRMGLPAVAPLMRFLKSNDPKLRDFAAGAIRFVVLPPMKEAVPQLKEAVPALLSLTSDDDPDIRAEAIQSLMWIDFDSPDVQKVFAKAVNDPKPKVRLAAVNGFQSRSPSAKTAVPALIDALKQGGDEVRKTTIAHLKEIGPDARTALPALQETATLMQETTKGSGSFAPSVIDAVTKIEPDKGKLAVFLVKLLNAHSQPDIPHQFSVTHSTAIAELQKISSEAITAVPELIEMLKSGNESKQSTAAWILISIGPDAKDAIPELQRLFQSKDQKVSQAAGEALKAIAR